jgi:cytochrome c oxidase subunit 4
MAQSTQNTHNTHNGGHTGHVSSPFFYLVIFAALLVLTFATVVVARIDLGVMNDVVALGIAVTKALLVLLFFMHVRYSTRLTTLTAVAGFLWLAILIGITLTDYISRGATMPVPGK